MVRARVQVLEMAKKPKPQLALNIIRRRSDLGLSAEKLAEEADVPYPTLRDIEAGISAGSRKTLEKIAKFFALSVDELYEPPAFRGPALTDRDTELLNQAIEHRGKDRRLAESDRLDHDMASRGITEFLNSNLSPHPDGDELVRALGFIAPTIYALREIVPELYQILTGRRVPLPALARACIELQKMLALREAALLHEAGESVTFDNPGGVITKPTKKVAAPTADYSALSKDKQKLINLIVTGRVSDAQVEALLSAFIDTKAVSRNEKKNAATRRR